MAWDILLHLRVRFLPSLVNSGLTPLLTAVNMMNVFLYRRAGHSIQSAGYIFLLFKADCSLTMCFLLSVSLAYAIVWIMSQRILIHVRGAYPLSVRDRWLNEVCRGKGTTDFSYCITTTNIQYDRVHPAL
jgi:hypothetical protein